MKRSLFFFTAEFPFGKGESFIENELPVLSACFEKIIIIPLSTRKKEQRDLKENCAVIDIVGERNDIASVNIFFRNFFFILSALWIEFLNTSSRFYFIRNIRHFNSLLIRALYDADKLEQKCPFLKEDVFYSFWMNDWALTLAVMKRKEKINNFVFRCGGFDIYDERHPGNYLPFRYFIYKYSSGIYPNSKMGESYIKSKNMFAEKVSVQYWGTTDHGINRFDKGKRFKLVSCSNLIGLKRVHLIVGILEKIGFELDWVHFGDGELKESMKKLAMNLPQNINWVFKGAVSNEEIIQYYKNEPVNLFITTSETEGLPVSIQEAISFGIPVLATNVGGISEVVNERTGLLIDKDFDVEKIAALVTEFSSSEMNSIEFRTGVRNFWIENFEAGKNYTYFYRKLTELTHTI